MFQKTKQRLHVSFHLPHAPDTADLALCGYTQLQRHSARGA